MTSEVDGLRISSCNPEDPLLSSLDPVDIRLVLLRLRLVYIPPIPLLEIFRGRCKDNFEDVLVGNGGGGKLPEVEDDVEAEDPVENLGVLAGVLGMGRPRLFSRMA